MLFWPKTTNLSSQISDDLCFHFAAATMQRLTYKILLKQKSMSFRETSKMGWKGLFQIIFDQKSEHFICQNQIDLQSHHLLL
jgi:hypothetical protein